MLGSPWLAVWLKLKVLKSLSYDPFSLYNVETIFTGWDGHGIHTKKQMIWRMPCPTGENGF